jgi:hypothetical protein
MPKPRTLTLTLSTQDDQAREQNVIVRASFTPELGPKETSFLSAILPILLHTIECRFGRVKPTITPSSEASLN